MGKLRLWRISWFLRTSQCQSLNSGLQTQRWCCTALPLQAKAFSSQGTTLGAHDHGTMLTQALPWTMVCLCSSKGACCCLGSIKGIRAALLRRAKERSGEEWALPSHRGTLGSVMSGVHNVGDGSMHEHYSVFIYQSHTSFWTEINYTAWFSHLLLQNWNPETLGCFHKSHPLPKEEGLNPLEIVWRKYHRPWQVTTGPWGLLE